LAFWCQIASEKIIWLKNGKKMLENLNKITNKLQIEKKSWMKSLDCG